MPNLHLCWSEPGGNLLVMAHLLKPISGLHWKVPMVALLLGSILWVDGFLALATTTNASPPPNFAIEFHERGVRFIAQTNLRPVVAQAIVYGPAGPVVSTTVSIKPHQLVLEVPHVRAGLADYTIQLDDQIIKGQFLREPGLPVTPLLPKLGARAVRVLQNRRPSLVMHPTDALGNVTIIPVDVVANYPDAKIWQTRLKAKHLVVFSMLPTSSRTGSIGLRVSSGLARAERAETDVLSGRLVSMQLQAKNSNAMANPREHWQIELKKAKDALGNDAQDGLAITLGFQDNNYHLFATRPLIRAANDLTLPVVLPVGEYKLVAYADGLTTPPITLRATPALRFRSIPVRLVQDNKNVRLEVGPVEDTQGALPDDGTPVQVTALSKQVEYTTTLYLTQGTLGWDLPALPANTKTLIVAIGNQQVLQPLRLLRPKTNNP